MTIMTSKHWLVCLFAIVRLVPFPELVAQTPAETFVQDILKAHRAWRNAPNSIQITGTSTRKTAKGPVTITATKREEVLIDYGADTFVATSTKQFRQEGSKLTIQPTPAGFAQLDVTSVFLLAQLTERPLTGGPPVPANVFGTAANRLQASTDRHEVHYRQFVVNDTVDIYVAGSGLLSGITRTFYESSPRFRFTSGLLFSDYRDTAGVLLPYRIERYVKENRVEVIDVTSYAFDVPAPASLFTPRRAQ